MADEAKPVRGECTIDLPEHPGYVLRPGFEAILGVENALGGGIIARSRKIMAGDTGLGDLVAIVWHCGRLVPENPKLSVERVADLVNELGVLRVWPVVVGMLDAALNAPPLPAPAGAPRAPAAPETPAG